VERILAMLINEAADALFWQVASATDIDLAMTKGVNYPKGLLAWSDEKGAAHWLGVLERLQAAYGEDRYRPSPQLRRMALA
jgi:3-hydroxybutyryl-CoA dehydrogenase